MKNSFSYEKFYTWTRFETEARENSEVAYWNNRHASGLDFQPLFGKGARAPPPNRHERAVEIEPTVHRISRVQKHMKIQLS